MEMGPLKEGYKVEVNQPKNSILPPLQIRSIVLGPGSSGKRVWKEKKFVKHYRFLAYICY